MTSASVRQATDVAVDQFKRTIGASPASVQEIFAPAIQALDSAGGTRRDIDASTTPVGLTNPDMFRAFNAYSTMVRAVFDANSKVALGVDDAQLRNGATIIDLWSRMREDSSDLVISLITGTRATDAAVIKRVANSKTREQVTFEEVNRTAVGPYEAIIVPRPRRPAPDRLP